MYVCLYVYLHARSRGKREIRRNRTAVKIFESHSCFLLRHFASINLCVYVYVDVVFIKIKEGEIKNEMSHERIFSSESISLFSFSRCFRVVPIEFLFVTLFVRYLNDFINQFLTSNICIFY